MFFQGLIPTPPTGEPVMIRVVYDLPAIRVPGTNDKDIVWHGPDASEYQGKVIDWRLVKGQELAECKAALQELQGA